MFFVTFTTVAQDWYPNDGYEFQIRMPEIRNLENFFYNEWELNPAEISFKLSDIEMLKKTNSHENIRYEITKNKLGITTVSIYVNTRIYSEAMYKNGVLEGKKINLKDFSLQNALSLAFLPDSYLQSSF